jgi:hypothetical protein
LELRCDGRRSSHISHNPSTYFTQKVETRILTCNIVGLTSVAVAPTLADLLSCKSLDVSSSNWALRNATMASTSNCLLEVACCFPLHTWWGGAAHRII